MSAIRRILLGLFLTAALAGCEPNTAPPQSYHGQVVDAQTGAPVKQAFVTLGNAVARAGDDGKFRIQGAGDTLRFRAYGYGRADVPATAGAGNQPVRLKPVTPRALYLSMFGAGDRKLRESALSLIRETELNALVIDVKGDRGYVAYRSAIPLAREVGAQRVITIKDIGPLVRDLHARGIYLIARIVAFKDNPLALARPALAVKTARGQVWKDQEGLAWTSPFESSVWDYNIAIAVEAARAGFDEIQFDYVRFPDTPGLAFGRPNTELNRVTAITSFLALARARLVPYNVFLAADFFGYVPWNHDDTGIGQKIGHLAVVLDYLSPMLYPSGFRFGIPGYQNPVLHPGEVVRNTLHMAQRRTGLPAVRFRPWLQAFRDYAFGAKIFGGREIRLQADAADQFGSDGWMLWNPRNVYTRQGLKPKR